MNKISRREFLAGAGASVLAPACAYGNNIEPQLIQDNDLILLKMGGSTLLSVNAKCAAPGGLLQSSVSSRHATIAGKLGTVIELTIDQTGDKWSVYSAWNFSSIGVRVSSKPVALRPQIPVELVTDIRGQSLKRLLDLVAGNNLKAPGRCTLRLNETSAWLDAGRGCFSVLNGHLAGRQLVLSTRGGTTAEFADELRSKAFVIGKKARVSAWLSPAAPLKAGFDVKKRLSLAGQFNLTLRNGKDQIADVPCNRALIGSQNAHRSWLFNTVDKPWRLTTPFTVFEVEAQKTDSADNEISHPLGLSIGSGGILSAIDCGLTVLATTLAVADADRTRFDLASPLQLALIGAPVPKSVKGNLAKVPLKPTFALSEPATPFNLNLDHAALRVWRGQDLFCLTFRFRNMGLSIGKTTALVPMPIADTAPNAPGEALLIAEFPPQHIMERTFLRQTTLLPDVEVDIAPARLRLLQRLEESARKNGSKPSSIAAPDYSCASEKEKMLLDEADTTDASVIRYNIRNEKYCREQRDNPGGPYVFAEFAKAWDDAQLSKQFGPWIGPAGLFSIAARRAARQLSEARRTEALGILKRKLDDGSFDSTDFPMAVNSLALPAFPLGRGEARAWLESLDRGERQSPPEDEHLDDFKKLINEAGRRSDDFAEVKKRAFPPGNASNPPLESQFVLLPQWPFTQQDKDFIFAGRTAPVVNIPQMKIAVRNLVEAELVATLDTAHNDEEAEKAKEAFRRPVQAWISDPSRVAFAVGDDPIQLNVDSLTNWASYELRVVQRAKRQYKETKDKKYAPVPESNPEIILKEQGISWGQPASGQQRMNEIVKTLIPPQEHDTALEVPTGLTLSPAQDARWITPRRNLPDTVAALSAGLAKPVWQARLIEAQRAPSLRAIWSDEFDQVIRRFDETNKGSGPSDIWTAPDDNKPYRTAMSPADRAELVALSSIYGLPVIAANDQSKSSQIKAPDRYVTDAASEPAVFMPVPLQTRRLALGSTGAMLDLDTTFPLVTAVRRKNGLPLYDSFSLQRWRTLISDGSDSITVVVRAGYLFPLGHKASLVKVTEPRLRPIDPLRPSAGYSVEQATRIYIEVTRASQQYPAVGQLHDARDYQAREVKLLTLRTPDLVDPADDKQPPEQNFTGTLQERAAAISDVLQQPLVAGPHGAVRGWIDSSAKPGEALPGRLVGIVFWPRTEKGTKGTVRFRMQVDGEATPISMPLMFADHRAASDPATMRALCDYYKGGKSNDSDKPKDWKRVNHFGAMRAYAEEQRKGQCTFATDWQDIEAVGGATSFNLDAALLAAEQPPFYPQMLSAQVRPQQIQGLTGSTAPALQVSYACDYVSYGFTPPIECHIADPDTYLVVNNNPRVMLDMGPHGDQGGTVARKAVEICGLNRRFGLAGPPIPTCTACTPATPPQKAGSLMLDYQKTGALSGLLSKIASVQPAIPVRPGCERSSRDPDTVLNKDLAVGQLAENATFLGLLKLRDFIIAIAGDEISSSNIPALEEITNFSDQAFIEVTNALRQPVKDLVAQLKAKAGDVIFPNFSATLAELDCVLDRASPVQGLPPLTTEEEIEIATQIWALGQQVAKELDAIARTPIGNIAERLRAYFVDSQGKIVDIFQNRFAPWNDVQLQLATLVAETAAKIPDGMVTFTDPDQSGELASAIKSAVALPSVWCDPNKQPFAAIVEKIKELGPPPNAGKLEDVLVEGPLYPMVNDLLAILRQQVKDFQFSSLIDAMKWASDAVDKAQALYEKFHTLASLDLTICNESVAAINDLLQAAVPKFDSGIADNAAKTLTQARTDIDKLRNDVAAAISNFGPVAQPSIDYLTKLKAFLDGWLNALSTQVIDDLKVFLAAASAVRKTVDDATSSGSCVQFGIETARAVARLRAARMNLLAAWISVANKFPNAPLPALWPEANGTITALSQQVRDQIESVVKSTISDAINFVVLFALHAGQQDWASARSLIAKDPDLVRVYTDLDAELKKIGKDFQDRLATWPNPSTGDAASAQKRAVDFIASVSAIDTRALAKLEKQLLDGAIRSASGRQLKEIEPQLNNYTKGVLNGIGVFYDTLIETRGKAYQAVQDALGDDGMKLTKDLFGQPTQELVGNDGCLDDWRDYIFLVRGQSNVCSPQKDALTDERDELNAGTKDTLVSILKRWADGKSAPQKLLYHVDHFARLGVRAAILRVFDVEQLRQTILDALARAIPTRRTLKSKLSLPLSTTSVGIGTFRPIGGEGTLTLDTTATVDLLNGGAPETDLKGIVSPFELEILSIMTFSFRDGLRYIKGPKDGRGDVTARLGAEDIQFGDKLSFLAELSSSLGFGGDGDGPYSIIHIDSPAIEAGYRIAIPVITLGVTFTNIHFAGAVILPFTSGAARLRMALGSLDSPFMISVGIYGGSGFMGFEASAQGIELFEASFEFGGIASLGYGPLQGTAYVTTGAYVRTEKGNGCTFAALFSAGFCAHIACFGISAAFTLRLRKTDGDSSVQGEAQLTFTFSVSFAKVHYTIRVARTMQAGFGGGGQQAAFNTLPSGTRLAALNGFLPDCYPFEQSAEIWTESYSPGETWSIFAAQFDPQFQPEFEI
ncbi:hypothetical protein [Mesorhizobium sp. M1B.F.Ca.ET.045.04.1.1]|uniref:hypothetical protein n=1 Tax=Mesorhizobium sp. M1B.F.Ca.ET.045.04.1.1 TaxID=2493673 RepID=UPI000F75D24A|nr:hypothetical protein [Mesorhizobium sp. M1B.F.Ca.ET.045.04.1.1]AZO29773.1 hypothetical protein EJ071_21805 [Mesorhizobium sp. M1B.F.Ca.ET.045.04.1.1]